MGVMAPSLHLSFLFTSPPKCRNCLGVFLCTEQRQQSHNRSTNQEGNLFINSQVGKQSRVDKIRIPKWVHEWISLIRCPKERQSQLGQWEGFSGVSISVFAVSTLEKNDAGCNECSSSGEVREVVTNAGITATSVVMSLAVKPSICHKIATMMCEPLTPTIKTITPQSLEESLIIHLFGK